MNRTTRHTLTAFAATLLLARGTACSPGRGGGTNACRRGIAGSGLEQQFANPPLQARLRAYWWWLNGNVTKEAITKDLEWMKASAWAADWCSTPAEPRKAGMRPCRRGPCSARPRGGDLFTHTLHEADRLGLEIGLNIQSGWNLGGPMVTPDKAAKMIAWSQFQARGPANLAVALPKPKAREISTATVLCSPTGSRPAADGKPLATGRRPGPSGSSRRNPPTTSWAAARPIVRRCSEDDPAAPGEEDVLAKDVLDLTDKLDKDGTLRWNVPDGHG